MDPVRARRTCSSIKLQTRPCDDYEIRYFSDEKLEQGIVPIEREGADKPWYPRTAFYAAVFDKVSGTKVNFNDPLIPLNAIKLIGANVDGGLLALEFEFRVNGELCRITDNITIDPYGTELNSDNYAIINRNADLKSRITTIGSFNDYQGDVTIYGNDYPMLTSIMPSVFSYWTGTLTMKGDFPSLTTSGEGVFAYGNGVVVFGDLPELRTIGDYAFYQTSYILTMTGDYPKLETIGSKAFAAAVQDLSLMFGNVSPSVEIASDAFKGFRGTVIPDAWRTIGGG